MALLILFLASVYTVLQSSRVQTYIIEKITHKISNDLNTKLSIQKVDLNWYLDLVLEGVYAEDKHADTLLYAKEIHVDVRKIDALDNHIYINTVSLNNSVIKLRKYREDSTLNLQFIIDYFQNPKPDSMKTSWNVYCSGLEIADTRFTYSNDHMPFKPEGIDFNHLAITDLNTRIALIKLRQDSVLTSLDHISFKEHKGFTVNALSGSVLYSPRGLVIRNLYVSTPKSELAMNLELIHEGLKPFKDFVNKVELDADFKPSKLFLGDLAYFVPGTYGMDNTVALNGNIEGKLSRLKARDFSFSVGKITRFAGDIDMMGLPDIKETFIHLSVNKLISSASDISNLKLPGGKSLEVPKIVRKLGIVNIRGKFTGFYNDFVSYADFNTQLGHIASDISLKSRKGQQKISYNGTITASGFNIGRLSGSDELETMDLMAVVKGSGLTKKNVNLTLNGHVDSLIFRKNTYDRIDISGVLAEQRFNGELNIIDDLVGFDFKGLLDFGGEELVYDFQASIDSAWLAKLNLVERDKSAILSTHIHSDFAGLDPDNMKGSIKIDSTYFSENGKTYEIGKMDISVDGRSPTRKFLRIDSRAFEVDVNGTYTISNFGKSFAAFINHYLPSLNLEHEPEEVGHQLVNLDVVFKEPGTFTDIFLPKLSIAPDTRLRLQFDTHDSLLRIFGKSDLIKFNNYKLSDWYLTSRSYTGGVMLKTGTKRLVIKEKGERKRDTLALGADNFFFSTDLSADTVNYFINWNDTLEPSGNKGEIGGFVDMSKYPKVGMKITQADMIMNDSSWFMETNNYLEIDSSTIAIKNYDISSNDQRLKMHGKISVNPNARFSIDFDNLALSNLDMFFHTMGIDLDGRINGRAVLSNVYKALKYTSDLNIEDFAFNRRTLGDARIKTNWKPSNQALDVAMEVIYEGNAGRSKPLSAYGYYYPERKTDNFDLDISLLNMKLGVLHPFLDSFIAKLEGYGSGDLHLGGELKKPKLVGAINAMRTELMVDYTKVTYSLADKILLRPTEIVFSDITVYDSLGNTATVNGSVYHDHFKNFRPDFTVQAQSISGLNLNSAQNELFYGQARASGQIRLFQSGDNLHINTNITSEEGTDIVIPISFTADVTSKDFIKFVGNDRKKKQQEKQYEVDLGSVVLNLEFEVTPEANIKIYLPYQMGNLEMTGAGDIRMEVGSTGGFNMFGNYEISQGVFLFQLENMISRTFAINEGSSIRWTGDPYNGILGVNAVYRTRPTLSSIPMYSEVQEYNERIPVNAIVKLRDGLSNPDISFSLGLPDVDEQTKRIVYSAVDTSNQAEMSRQMISLLVLDNFSFSASNAGLASSVESSSFDLLSSQVSNWLSQISKEVDIGVNYRPGTDISTEELEVALSTQLFNNRVIIDGNVGYLGEQSNRSNASNIVGDVNVEVKLTRDGRLRLKAFNKSNNIYLFDNYAPYTQGVGVSYRKEFDTFRELLGIEKETPPDSLLLRDKIQQDIID